MIFKKDIKLPDMFGISGEVVVIDDLKAINQSIELILKTAKGELFGDPNFGCRIYEYAMMQSGKALIQAVINDIYENLNEQEPRIFVNENDISVEEDMDNQRLIINIKYNIRYTEYVTDYVYILDLNKAYKEV